MKPAILAFALLIPVPVSAQDPTLTLAEARASLAGSWQGELQYRDYQADSWFGIPVTVEAELVADGVTLIRRAAYDDGPARGTVYITTVQMLGPDGATEFSATFRADRASDLGIASLALMTAVDRTHWVIRAEADGMDDNRPARVRETTTREGDSLTTLKEVDFSDDDSAEWLVRNRSILSRESG